MPFTLAHPAAILPLRGLRYLRTVPLIIGAMTPDLPYFVPARFGLIGPETHSVTGSFTTCLALGYAALACVFLLRRPLTALLSARARWLCLTALAPFSRRPLEWALASVSILLGVWTHLLWDSFTHNDGWVVRRVAVLSAPVTFGAYHLTVCHVLQYLSSAVGLAALALWYWRLPTPPAAPLTRTLCPGWSLPLSRSACSARTTGASDQSGSAATIWASRRSRRSVAASTAAKQSSNTI